MKKGLLVNVKLIVALCICILFVFGYFWFVIPYTFVSIDINASIGLEINRFGIVLDVVGKNEQGKEIIQNIDIDQIRYHSTDVAMKSIIEELTVGGYLIDKTNAMVFSGSSNNCDKTQEVLDKLEKETSEILEDQNVTVPIKTAVIHKSDMDQIQATE